MKFGLTICVLYVIIKVWIGCNLSRSKYMLRYLNMPLLVFIISISFFVPSLTPSAQADELVFNSAEEARAAAKKRAQEYDAKMKEYLSSEKSKWEKEQASNSGPVDIEKLTKITYDEGDTQTEEGKALSESTGNRLDELKDQSLNNASENSVAMMAATAGYQWKIKVKDGKYVLTDSFSAASFQTGNNTPENPKTNTPNQPVTTPEKINDPQNNPDEQPEIAANPESTPPPAVPTNFDEEAKTAPEPGKESPAEAPKPGESYDPSLPVLPPPAVRLVIQHPLDQTEEIFSCNPEDPAPEDLKLEEFRIPEDTRVRMNLELSDAINPDDVTMVVVDDEGETEPIPAARFSNYRHLFRVPSDDQYFVKVFVKDAENFGQPKQIMQVAIPVTKVDFDSRSIERTR